MCTVEKVKHSFTTAYEHRHVMLAYVSYSYVRMNLCKPIPLITMHYA